METSESANSNSKSSIMEIIEIEGDVVDEKDDRNKNTSLQPVSSAAAGTAPEFTITPECTTPNGFSSIPGPLDKEEVFHNETETAVEDKQGLHSTSDVFPTRPGLSRSQKTLSFRNLHRRASESLQELSQQASSNENSLNHIQEKCRVHSATHVEDREGDIGRTLTTPTSSLKLPHPVELRQRNTPSQSASWSVHQNYKSGLRSSSSPLSSPMTKLLPLLSSHICIERTFRYGSSQFISPGDQLESCFADRQIRIFIVTWNMMQMKDLPESIEDLLLPPHQDLAADMYVIGTQESTSSRREWELLLQQTLGPSFVLVQTAVLGMIYLTFFIRRDLIWFCSTVKIATFATRPVTAIKTKGAVGLSFSLFGSSFLFITSHFTATQNKVAERNSDMKRTALNLDFSNSTRDEGTDVTTKFDYVFWSGDFNYRVDMDRKTADQLLSSHNYLYLLMEDQLTKEILRGNVFQGFSEQPIGFPPSYKYNVGTDIYDTSAKVRVPSWTDRILYRSKAGEGISGVLYFSCPYLKCSDHKPVCAIFTVELKPSSHREGIPDNIASFNRDVYEKAIKQRKQLTEQLLNTPDNEVDGSTSSSTDRRAFKNTSQFCVIL